MLGVEEFLGSFHPLRHISQILVYMSTDLLILNLLNVALKNLRSLER